MVRQGLCIFGIFAAALLLPRLTGALWPFVTALALAGILAIALDSVNRWLGLRVPEPAFASAITTLAATGLLGTMLGFTSVAVNRELRANHELLLQHSLEEGGWMDLVTQTADRILDMAYTPLARGLNLDRNAVPRDAIRAGSIESLRDAAAFLEKDTGITFGGSKTFWITGVVAAILLFLLLQYGQEWIMLLPFRIRDSYTFDAAYGWVTNHVNDTLVEAALQGALLAVGFRLAGVRSPVLLGSICGVMAATPIVGSPLVWAPVTLSFLAMGEYWRAILLMAWGILVVGGVGLGKRRLAQTGRDKHHPMVKAPLAIVGTYALGILGVLLIPLTFSLVATVLEQLRELLQ